MRFFRKCVTFSGRASLSEYWWAQLFQLVVTAPAIVMFVGELGRALSAHDEQHRTMRSSVGQGSELGWSNGRWVASVVMLVVAAVVFVIPQTSLTSRRRHDVNIPGRPFALTLSGVHATRWAVLRNSNPEGARFDEDGGTAWKAAGCPRPVRTIWF